MLALEVLPRCWDAVIVQAAGNLGGVAAFQSLTEDTTDYISRLRVYGQFVPNGWMQDVAVWSVATDNLPCFIIWIFADVVFTERSLLYAA